MLVILLIVIIYILYIIAFVYVSHLNELESEKEIENERETLFRGKEETFTKRGNDE